MTKKIFDIIPPDKVGKEEEGSPEAEIAGKKELRKQFIEPEVIAEGERRLKTGPAAGMEPGRKPGFSWIFGPIFFASLIFVGFKISKAEIQIWPRTERVSFQTEISMDAAVQEIDLESRVIPAKIVENEKVLYEEFSATGKALKKAEGTITLYNAYSTTAENWLEGTRFVSADGKLFKSKAKIAVPGAKLEGGKLVPSSVDVPVIAAEAGGDYNIEPTHFSVYVFRGTPRYTKFYGESTSAMAGGGQSFQITQQDFDSAKDSLEEKTTAACEQELADSVPETRVFLGDTAETEISESVSASKPGDEIEKFSFKTKAESGGLAMEKQDITEFVKQFVFAQIPQYKDLYEQSLKISYTVLTSDLSEGKASVSLDISAEVYEKIDAEILKGELIGKSLLGTRFFLENQPEINKVKVEFWPFWVKNVPKDSQKIEIDYNFGD